MGFVDRGGGREAKGASLRRSKKNPGAAAARAKTEAKGSQPATKVYAERPDFGNGNVMDCAVAVLSRKFDADRDRLLDRARDEAKCVAVLTWCGEVERQEALVQYCCDYPGRAFCAVGVHPDNVDRTNKKAHQGWIETTESIARSPTCVAVLTGLDLTREQATHFSQEALMQELFSCAKRLKLPVMLHLHEDHQTLERFTEWYTSNLVTLTGVAMLFTNASKAMCYSTVFADFLRETPSAYSIISSTGLFGDRASQFEAALAKLPLDRVLIGTNSPWDTPQNITDEHLRLLPNEPGNYSYVAKALANALSLDEHELAHAVQNTVADVLFKPVEVNESSQPCDEPGDEAQRDSDSDRTSSTSDEAGPVVDDNVGQGDSLIGLPDAKPSSYYSCVKCRGRSFPQTALVTHRSDAKKVTFKSAKLRSSEGCESTLFLLVRSGAIDGGLTISGDVVLCQGCGGKMGSVAMNAPCPCGAVMEGTTARIIASRVELLRQDVEDEHLLALAKEERETQPESSSDSDSGANPSRRKMKQNVKANNRSNMSHYRNKNWAPGLLAASEGLRAQVDSSVIDGESKAKKRRKGQRGHVSDDE
jgi:Tat protein secretion system quality control protein TatD with DNase activity